MGDAKIERFSSNNLAITTKLAATGILSVRINPCGIWRYLLALNTSGVGLPISASKSQYTSQSIFFIYKIQITQPSSCLDLRGQPDTFIVEVRKRLYKLRETYVMN